MPGRLGTLILAFTTLAACAGPAQQPTGSWVWEDDDPAHGGYSAIEVTEGGRSAVVLSDRGQMVQLRIRRGPAGQIAGIETDGGTTLAAFDGGKATPDTEGLAIPEDGDRFYISVERNPRVLAYVTASRTPRSLPVPEAFEALPTNRALEGLAVDADGALWTMPEDASGDTLSTYILRGTTWQDGPALPRRGEFVPVGLDFDDTGRLYLLERDLEGVLGFRSRVRRFTFAGNEIASEEELLATLPGVHDNLEGIAVWRDDAGGLRLTMISDDNFFFVQQTELVEYDVPD